jgi:hypothetical protein
VKWDVLNDEQPPYDFLTLLQKSEFNAELVRTFAQKKHAHNILVNELTRLLEPAPEFTKLAIEKIETRNLTPKVLEFWKPVVAGAIGEWAKQRTLSTVLNKSPSQDETKTATEPDGDHDPSERHALRKKFWEALLDRPNVKTTRHGSVSASESGWISAGSGVRGLPFTYVIGKEDGRVELYIDRGAGKKAENKEIFDGFQKHQAEIEKVFGGELSWHRLDDKQGSRISCATTLGGYRSAESKWPEIQEAMIEAMIRLEKALAPHLAKLKTELALEGA